MKLVIASRNQHKIKEIKAILDQISELEIVPLDGYAAPEIDEDQDTFLGNATKKALETAKYINETVLADDSGLVVDALGGAPGVYSARYAVCERGIPTREARSAALAVGCADANSGQLCAKLLRELKDIPAARRAACFVTTLVVASPQKILYTAEGRCAGLIAEAPRGEQGFGYDPVFYYPPLGRTFAELSPEEKNAHSHRRRALENLFIQLKSGFSAAH
ncbi:MAG: RdgB/HAM1 family non-canonical purine NTP pyrophosphatase [Candidatus Margulisbacteria bacterium]|jgi:XTP/dITP diphosphohydrolase|nr:RdgB/HAM1 family non-canonical purine NTP pyrophosphatase [Candidatus Margulisiibacteriota bacterium]